MIVNRKELVVMEGRRGDRVLFIPSGHQCDILSIHRPWQKTDPSSPRSAMHSCNQKSLQK